ncbi:SDR family NAD(P)-dependent oxidoreductase [Saccharothrix sp. ALI-22-I]|uniref:SDR family NAD(P)-dependent oxidoreductase n=1 Tax=Saccharothrix sp. ALI-22-I TaxID=1933778 RepID=UPI0019311283
MQADITDRTQAGTAVQQSIERFGRLGILVDNAGLMLLVRSSARTPTSGTA